MHQVTVLPVGATHLQTLLFTFLLVYTSALALYSIRIS